jgi:hypothetical protein
MKTVPCQPNSCTVHIYEYELVLRDAIECSANVGQGSHSLGLLFPTVG